MPSILAISPYPNRSADTRYRITQFIPMLEKVGWQVTLRTFMDERLFDIYNANGHLVEKLGRTALASFHRLVDCLTVGRFDVVIIHKEAFPFGPPLMERILRFGCPNIIYDMDDAFWTHPPQIKQIGRVFRDPGRIGKIIQMSSHVLAGNSFLASYAEQYNSSVILFPTVLDTDRYFLREEIADEMITIGWVGRWSSSPYLERLIPVFETLSAQFPSVDFRFVGAGSFKFPESIRYSSSPWKLDSEIEDIARFDIGIMPLPDDIYGQGKCGFKLLQYMALGISAVASPVGVNNKIVQDGENGFLAITEEEWIEKLSLLIRDQKLRKRIGMAARNTIESKYSLATAVPVLMQILEGFGIQN